MHPVREPQTGENSALEAGNELAAEHSAEDSHGKEEVSP